jgi:erythromycin esterase
MPPLDPAATATEVTRLARPLRDDDDLDQLITSIADARVVMLGEATHGTAEFYDWRRRITRRLVIEHGFGFVAVEGDWPDAARIDNWVRGAADGASRAEARRLLSQLDRWPTWMWANEQVAELVEWMARYNAGRPPFEQVRFHGLDVYSLYKSISAVIQYLKCVDPELAAIASERYACFEAYRPDEIEYARAALRMPPGCEEEAVANLVDLVELRVHNGGANGASLFDARQNALVVRNADRYYRTMLRGDERSWNIRDNHMLDTLDLLMRLGASSDGAAPKRGIVWAHNTHIGDYRATDMEAAGYVNLGGLARRRYAKGDVVLVGFGTYAGSVIASPAWDGPAIAMPVPEARANSYEHALHTAEPAGGEDFFMSFDAAAAAGPLAQTAGHRAIGVVYDPDRESRSNYVPTSLANRYDAFVFIHESEALSPLPASFDPHEVPETWPTGA